MAHRGLDGHKLSKEEKRYWRIMGWRMYDLKCPFSMPHTKQWCGYDKCPEA